MSKQSINNTISMEEDNTDNFKLDSEDPFTSTASNNENVNSDPFANIEDSEVEDEEEENIEAAVEDEDEDEDEEEISIEMSPKKKTKAKTTNNTKPKERTKTNKKEDAITNNKDLTPLEAINEFYALKYRYESTNFNKFIKPILKSNKSKREKKLEYSKLPKFPCINCKRNVNTIFKVNHELDEMIHKYIAKCGDIQDPCPLNIEIHHGEALNLQIEIKNNFSSIENIKKQIIKEKNNVLFFKNTNEEDIIRNFETLTNKLKEETEYSGAQIEEYILKNDNPVRSDILNAALMDFGQELLLPFKDMVGEYMKTDDEMIINNAVHFYKNEMVPKLKEIQELKYDINGIEYNDNDNTYHLIQLKNSIDRKETVFSQDNKVVSFTKGIKGSAEKSMNKSKTLKIKPSLSVSSYSSSSRSKTIRNRDSVLNLNPKEQLWARLPEKLKAQLNTNSEWKDEFIEKCIEDKKKPGFNGCRLMAPSNIIIPPNQNADGKYDFGVEIYNLAFNKQPQTTQKTYLTLYKEDPNTKQKDYTMLKEAVNKLVEKEVNFGSGFF
jgi:hypothetical protein